MYLNQVTLVGRLTRDPELKHIPSGSKVVNVGLATTRTFKNKAGEKQEATEFHSIVAWERLAEIIGDYCKKGDLLLVQGRIQYRKWKSKEGENHVATDIVAESIQLGPKSGKAGKPADSGIDLAADPKQRGQQEEIPVVQIHEEDAINQYIGG